MANSIGLIGFGSFGKFIFKHLSPYFEINVHDEFISKSNLGPSKITVTVIGEVSRPGKQNISANSPVLMGIMSSGGFTNKAKKSNVSVLRLVSNSISKTKFNLSQNKESKDEFYLEDGDVIFVDRNNLTKTTDNLKIATEPIRPIITAASFYRLLFRN